mgnify:FL=1
MIARIWHGWSEPANADTYEQLLRSEIFPGILAKKIAGLDHIDLLRRDHGGEVEFITLMWFDDLAAIKAFVGEDYETAYVPAAARKILARFDARSQHYEIRARA